MSFDTAKDVDPGRQVQDLGTHCYGQHFETRKRVGSKAAGVEVAPDGWDGYVTLKWSSLWQC